MSSQQTSSPSNQNQQLTSFVRKDETGEVVKQIKDDELVSGRLNNNLGPVIFHQTSPSINDQTSPKKEGNEISKPGHGATMLISIQSNPSKPSNVIKEKEGNQGGQHYKSQAMLLSSNGQGNTMKGQIFDQSANPNGEDDQYASGSMLINEDLNDLDCTSNSALKNVEKKDALSLKVPGKVQLVRRKKEEVPKKTHQEMMEEIENIGALERGRLASKQLHVQGRPNDSYHYRSASAFMKRAQQAAEAQGRQEKQKYLSKKALVDKNLELQNETFKSECKAAKEQQSTTGREERNQKQSYLRNQRNRRIGTAIDPKYGGSRLRNVNRYESAERHLLGGKKIRGIRGTDTHMMRQSQQNLNKLRMSQASISNLNAMNMKKSFEQFTQNYKCGQNLGISGNQVGTISLQQVRSQAAMSQNSRYRNSIRNYQAFYQQRTTHENPTTAEYPGQSREGTLSDTTGVQGTTFLQSPFEGQDHDPQSSGKMQIKSAQNRNQRPVPPLDLNRNTDDCLSNGLITSQMLIQSQAQKRGKSGHIDQKNRRYANHGSRNTRYVCS